MATTETQLRTSKRQLVFHDSVAFMILLAVTAVLFAITLFLFRSFSAHRAEIGRRAGEDGRIALSEHRPHDAVADLRTALAYAPNGRSDGRSYELLLAQALGEDGHLEEATNYFLNLWEAQPGDGFINLQLARLERQRSELEKNDRQRNGAQTAINYYRASIFGSWNGDGVVHRREVRLELADYLIDQRQFALAQTELLIAASNAPSDAGLSVLVGDKLLRVNDQADAMKQYQRAVIEDPQSAVAYERMGRLAYSMGDFTHAREWLEEALRKSAEGSAEATGEMKELLKNTERLLVLDPDSATRRADRVGRILEDRSIAKRRLDVCLKGSTTPRTSLDALKARWRAPESTAGPASLMRDDAGMDHVRSLINDTEKTTAEVCGAPDGDDALLLLLADRGAKQ